MVPSLQTLIFADLWCLPACTICSNRCAFLVKLQIWWSPLWKLKLWMNKRRFWRKWFKLGNEAEFISFSNEFGRELEIYLTVQPVTNHPRGSSCMIDGSGPSGLFLMLLWAITENIRRVPPRLFQGLVRVLPSGVGLWTVLVVGFWEGALLWGWNLYGTWVRVYGYEFVAPRTVQRGPILSSDVPQGCI